MDTALQGNLSAELRQPPSSPVSVITSALRLKVHGCVTKRELAGHTQSTADCAACTGDGGCSHHEQPAPNRNPLGTAGGGSPPQTQPCCCSRRSKFRSRTRFWPRVNTCKCSSKIHLFHDVWRDDFSEQMPSILLKSSGMLLASGLCFSPPKGRAQSCQLHSSDEERSCPELPRDQGVIAGGKRSRQDQGMAAWGQASGLLRGGGTSPAPSRSCWGLNNLQMPVRPGRMSHNPWAGLAWWQHPDEKADLPLWVTGSAAPSLGWRHRAAGNPQQSLQNLL